MGTFQMNVDRQSVAFFVTPHGFGHASRAIAVAESLGQLLPQLQFIFFTTVPKRHIAASIENFSYEQLNCDVGLMQTDALMVDLPKTIERLNAFLPFDPIQVRYLVNYLRNIRCIAVVSDIAPLGIKIAQAAGLPSVLIENFTWDWIYRAYSQRYPSIVRYADYLAPIFAGANLHLQCDPVGNKKSSVVLTSPVSRRFQKTPSMVRDQLGLSYDATIVFVSMGGTPHSLPDLEAMGKRWSDIYFIVSNYGSALPTPPNVYLIPIHDSVFHPDLVRAADVVIGKAGYSTVAEVYHAGVPFGYFSRKEDPETPSLLSFVNNTVQGIHLIDHEYQSDGWLDHLPKLLSMPRIDRSREPNGADQCANAIVDFMESQ